MMGSQYCDLRSHRRGHALYGQVAFRVHLGQVSVLRDGVRGRRLDPRAAECHHHRRPTSVVASTAV